MEPKAVGLILDIRTSSLEVDLHVLGNRDEFPVPAAELSRGHRAIFPRCCCDLREKSVCARKPIVTRFIQIDEVVTFSRQQVCTNERKMKGKGKNKKSRDKGDKGHKERKHGRTDMACRTGVFWRTNAY